MTNKQVYIKDSEGFVTKKLESEILPGEVIITKQEFENISGLTYYKEVVQKGINPKDVEPDN